MQGSAPHTLDDHREVSIQIKRNLNMSCIDYN